MSDLVDRLRGIYRIPITDGLGATGGGEEPSNADEFVRRFEVPRINREAADEIERITAEVRRLKDANAQLQEIVNSDASEEERLRAENASLKAEVARKDRMLVIAGRVISGEISLAEADAEARAAVKIKPLSEWGCRELARAAGISPTTASRVLRGEKVLDAGTVVAVLKVTGHCLCCGRQEPRT